MVLTIKYGTGCGKGIMNVNVEEFLNKATLKDFKKLLKIIDMSDTPEVKEQLKEYITNILIILDENIKANLPMPAGWFKMTYRKQKVYKKYLALL